MKDPLGRVIITAAITGNLTRPDQSPYLPITPQQIAESALAAAEAGAAVVHLHVRDPATGAPSMQLALYREVVARIRDRNADVVINLTTGAGGRYVPSDADPAKAGPGTTLLPPEARVEHVVELRPDICTLDLNTMNSGDQVVINTPRNVRRMAQYIHEAGVKPEYELFDSGDIALLHDLLKDGPKPDHVLTSFVMGVKYGFQPSPETVIFARNLLPQGADFTAIGIGRQSFPTVAQSYLAGGHVRVGLEDGVYIDRGQLAPSNAALVLKARTIVEALGGQIATAKEARELLHLGSVSEPAQSERGKTT